MSKRIVVIQRRMTHYRVAFFEALCKELENRNLELVLAYGEGTLKEQGKNDGAHLPWAHKLRTRYLFGGRLCWQPIGHLCQGASMLVVTLENKLICNLWHQFTETDYKVGLWGHGANLQGNPHSLREKFKRMVARRADWWFGYTDHSRPLIERTGFPSDQITILDNAIDTAEMRSQYEAITPAQLDVWRQQRGLGNGSVGIFLGSFYGEKRIDFLLAAASQIRSEVPDFELLMVGAGPQKQLVEDFCRANPWAHFAGMLKGQEKVLALASATIMLNPGLVGLGILDSFVCEVPMLTTDCGLHSPEIVYLQSGVNGVMTPDTMAAYVNASVQLLGDASKLRAMKAACKQSGAKYTVENMAKNFADGVEECVNSSRLGLKAGA